MGLSKDERHIVVTGIPDPAKGEALVLLSSQDLDFTELKAKLTEAGLPNLWIPRKLQRVETIPVLASGKLDLQKCKELAVAG
jgi:acyl-[acyl-carrier-protein]-phospholipid O-acyltransferase/long-chain-fatty-acid--[acyl-carrier-protein] ligase